jgi:hypothetical protein
VMSYGEMTSDISIFWLLYQIQATRGDVSHGGQ